MVTPRSKSDVNLKLALDRSLLKMIPIIEKKLEGHIAGDIVIVYLSELNLSSEPSPNLYANIVSSILKQYKEAGWDVNLVGGDNSTGPKFTFK